jgi:hypothetical protein
MPEIVLGAAVLAADKRQDAGGTPLGFFVSVHSTDFKVLCFDTVSQVFILQRLRQFGHNYLVTPRVGSFLARKSP